MSKRRLPIRARLALTSMALVIAVLLLVGATVLILEQRTVDGDLRGRASIEAGSLLAVAARAERPPSQQPDVDDSTLPTDEQSQSGAATVPGVDEAEPETTRTARPAAQQTLLDASTGGYLVRRSASGILLAVGARGTVALLNRETARPLATLLNGPAGLTTQTIDGLTYIVAVRRDASGIAAAAAVPGKEADDRIAALARALLIAGVLGALATMVLAWLAAREALRPLGLITRRAEGITAGALDTRVGPIGGHDEIARMTIAIDGMLERLEASFAAKQRFTQDASHELRTPITIARGHLEVLDPRHEHPAEIQTAIDLAVDELDRMGRLVERLLLLARAGELPQAGRERVDLGELAEAALERVRDDSGRAWAVTVTGAPLLVDGDEDALVDVIVNLLRNAQRHTTTTGTIAVRVQRDDDAVTLTVEDDGDGIDPAVLPLIFDRFTRADSARSRDQGGAGLGLAICRAYVEAHGGAITATSVPHHGATFTVRLPLAR